MSYGHFPARNGSKSTISNSKIIKSEHGTYKGLDYTGIVDFDAFLAGK